MADLKLVTLTSDFGWQSEACGVMEAAVLELCHEARVVHLSHGVEPFSTMDGARQLECVLTIVPGCHIAVVDPGVGSERLPIVLDVPRVGYLIGPDNGVLLPTARRAGGVHAARRISNPSVIRQPVSTTFHGRDYFAAAAGHLARGTPFAEMGETVYPDQLVPPPYAEARVAAEGFQAVVIHVNRFGNCILNVLEDELLAVPTPRVWRALAADSCWRRVPYFPYFSAVPTAEPLLTPDSYGRVGLAVNQGSAAEMFGLRLGAHVTLEAV